MKKYKSLFEVKHGNFSLAIVNIYGQTRFKEFDTKENAIKWATDYVNKLRKKMQSVQEITLIDQSKKHGDKDWNILLHDGVTYKKSLLK